MPFSFSAVLLSRVCQKPVKRFSLVSIPVMALIFGARESTGILLPMLLAADIMAVIYYRKNAVWKHIFRVLPWVAAGILTALITGNRINAGQFRILLLSVTWLMLILLIVNDFWKRRDQVIPETISLQRPWGFAGGFASMIGNASGPVFTLYFLAMRLPKKEFIGTGAWLFLIINTSKLPLHLYVWKTISQQTLMLDLIAIPFIAAGIYAGIHIVKLFPEKAYRVFVVFTTLITSVLLLL
jgi:uncharacterized membrane protein YfcA